ncbi:ADOP family duplicated permease [Silvibacterium sp.]|uniref:ABC transporter permease n=1 Tax=Silvibacterium sp. TaxID=1964179 RepID=UPI0039E2C759
MRILHSLFRRRRYDDLAVSIREHLEEKVDELMEEGLSREEAERAARRSFGNVALLEERSREAWQWPTAESLLADVRFTLRQLAGAPGFTLACLLTLALGIGGNVAVFSLLDAVLFHPLPYRDPGKIMFVTETLPAMSLDEVGVSVQESQDYIARSHSFEAMGTYDSDGANLTGDGEPLRVKLAKVSSSIFPLLGVSPALGRAFTHDEDQAGHSHVAILSWRLWQSKYHGDRAILGRTIQLDEKPVQVIGVMPPSFRFPFDGQPVSEMADLWLPYVPRAADLKPENRTMEFGVGLVGRLRPGVTGQQAGVEIAQICEAFEKEHADIYNGSLRLQTSTRPFAAYSMQKARPLALLLMAAVVCVLLIACANVANLLLARAGNRTREMAIRAAIGAGRVRLLRQCLVESLVLSMGGATAGIALAEMLLFALRRWGPSSVPRLHDVSLHGPVLLFALGITLVAAVLFGLVPAWKLAHTAPQAALRDTTQIGGTRGSQRLLHAIAISEIALAITLLIAGGLLIRSFERLIAAPFGFHPEGVTVVRSFFDLARYPDSDHRVQSEMEVLDRLSHVPGVVSASVASNLPLSDRRQIGIHVLGAPPDELQWAENAVVTPGYFRTMGISLLRGRNFTEHDESPSTPVAIVSETFARQLFPGRAPIGRRFEWWGPAPFTIIGIVADVHVTALDADPPPMAYMSLRQEPHGAGGRAVFLLQAADGRAPDLAAIRQAVWSVDRELPLYSVTTLSALVEESLAQRRFTLQVLTAFAISATSLAAIGLFGVLSYLVEQRSREFGVRMALGADRGRILTLIARRGLLLGAAGSSLGLLLAFVATSLLRGSLYHVSRFDPLTYIAVPLLLMMVSLAAVLIPARRAAAVDPMQALRSE